MSEQHARGVRRGGPRAARRGRGSARKEIVAGQPQAARRARRRRCSTARRSRAPTCSRRSSRRRGGSADQRRQEAPMTPPCRAAGAGRSHAGEPRAVPAPAPGQQQTMATGKRDCGGGSTALRGEGRFTLIKRPEQIERIDGFRGGRRQRLVPAGDRREQGRAVGRRWLQVGASYYDAQTLAVPDQLKDVVPHVEELYIPEASALAFMVLDGVGKTAGSATAALGAGRQRGIVDEQSTGLPTAGTFREVVAAPTTRPGCTSRSRRAMRRPTGIRPARAASLRDRGRRARLGAALHGRADRAAGDRQHRGHAHLRHARQRHGRVLVGRRQDLPAPEPAAAGRSDAEQLERSAAAARPLARRRCLHATPAAAGDRRGCQPVARCRDRARGAECRRWRELHRHRDRRSGRRPGADVRQLARSALRHGGQRDQHRVPWPRHPRLRHHHRRVDRHRRPRPGLAAGHPSRAHAAGRQADVPRALRAALPARSRQRSAR